MSSREESSDRRNRIQAVDVTSRILMAVSELRRPGHLKEISEAAGIQPAKAHRYVASLVDNGFVRQNELSGLYELGPNALKLGICAIESNDVVRESARATASLCQSLKTSGHLAIWGERGPVIISTEHGGPPIISTMAVGSTLPMLRSATGRAFLTFMPRGATAEIVESERAVLGMAPSEIEEIRARTRARGYSRIFEGLVPGLFAVSLPVFQIDGNLACAVTLISTDRQFFQEGSPHLAATLERYAEFSNAPRTGAGG